MRGVDVLCEVLADEGVTHIFGNPGTTELPLIAELPHRSELQYVLGLQEGTVVAMADGYARITGRPAFINVHAGAGLGAAIGNLTNAVAHRAPIVVTAGNADTRHAIAEPLLSGDLVGLAAGVAKWRHEVRQAAELGTVVRRAFRLAASPPRGPVFVSLPSDILEEEIDDRSVFANPARSILASGAIAGGLDRAAEFIAQAHDSLAIVVGDAVAEADALDEAAQLASLLGAPVFGAAFYSRRVFPTAHPLWQGMLPATAEGVRRSLERFGTVLLLDHQAFLVYGYTAGPTLPDGLQLLHLTSEPDQIGRTHPVVLGMVGDVRASLQRLIDLIPREKFAALAAERQDAGVAAHAKARQRLEATIVERSSAGLHPMVAAHALVDSLPAESIVVDEAITTGSYLRGLHGSSGAKTYWFCRGGGLGWGMPAAAGISLGAHREPVLAVIGDGSAMYAPQALWTAARERLPIIFAVVDNGEYAILKRGLEAAGVRQHVGLDLGDPPLDFVALAASMGVPASRPESVEEIRSTIASRWGSSGPYLLHVPLSARG